MFITAQGCRLRNDLYYVKWDVKVLLYHTIDRTVELIVPNIEHCELTFTD